MRDPSIEIFAADRFGMRIEQEVKRLSDRREHASAASGRVEFEKASGQRATFLRSKIIAACFFSPKFLPQSIYRTWSSGWHASSLRPVNREDQFS